VNRVLAIALVVLSALPPVSLPRFVDPLGYDRTGLLAKQIQKTEEEMSRQAPELYRRLVSSEKDRRCFWLAYAVLTSGRMVDVAYRGVARGTAPEGSIKLAEENRTRVALEAERLGCTGPKLPDGGYPDSTGSKTLDDALRYLEDRIGSKTSEGYHRALDPEERAMVSAHFHAWQSSIPGRVQAGMYAANGIGPAVPPGTDIPTEHAVLVAAATAAALLGPEAVPLLLRLVAPAAATAPAILQGASR
jgi:hypothetical protein